jgi:hypothetical protein
MSKELEALELAKLPLEVIEPPGEGDSVELIHALTWAQFRHSVDLETLLEKTRHELELSEGRVRVLLQRRWRKIASLAREGKIEVWGKALIERRFDGSESWRSDTDQQLTSVELRNCRFLSWPWDEKAGRRMPRIEHHADTYRGSWKRRTAQTSDQLDFVRVSVTRSGLLKEFGKPARAVANERASAARVRRAASEMSKLLATMDRRLVRKEDVLKPMAQAYGLSIRHGGEAEKLWRLMTKLYPELRTSGPKPNSPTAN